jgi:type IV pilus assembly protein PilV
VKRTKAVEAIHQRGASLIEILVALVILSVGLLGLAGLQLRGMQVNQGSQWRSMAAIMAEDLADRMRADVNAANPANMATSTGFYGSYSYSPGASNTNLSAAMQNWLATTLGELPAGNAPPSGAVTCGTSLPCVQVSALGTGNPTPIQIDVYWNDARAANGASETTTIGSYHVVAMLTE